MPAGRPEGLGPHGSGRSRALPGCQPRSPLIAGPARVRGMAGGRSPDHEGRDGPLLRPLPGPPTPHGRSVSIRPVLFPLRSDAPTYHRPWATAGIIAVNVVAFLWSLQADE